MKRIRLVIALVLFTATTAGHGATGSLIANVNQILLSGDVVENNYGGCMAAFSVWPNTVLGSCPGAWLTFSCTGDFAPTSVQAYRMLDQAQLALAANKKVLVFFRDDMKHNGYCYAYEMRLIR